MLGFVARGAGGWLMFVRPRVLRSALPCMPWFGFPFAMARSSCRGMSKLRALCRRLTSLADAGLCASLRRRMPERSA